jgi:hypothetical protein
MQQQPTPRTDGGASIAQKYGLQRSPLWPRVEKAVLQKFSKCATCSSTATLQVHHIVPFHLCHLVYRGDLELDERNLMVLCEESVNDHHLLVGHLGDFESYNPGGRTAIEGAFIGLSAQQIKSDPTWQALMKNRPVPWVQMQHKDRLALRQYLDTNFPFLPTAIASAPFPFLDDGTVNEEAKATTYH